MVNRKESNLVLCPIEMERNGKEYDSNIDRTIGPYKNRLKPVVWRVYIRRKKK